MKIIILYIFLIPAQLWGSWIDEIWISGSERRAQTTEKWDFEFAIGSSDCQLGYERDEGKYGWLYDIIVDKKTGKLSWEYSDRYRGVFDLNYQSVSCGYLISQGVSSGFSLAGDEYSNWVFMINSMVNWKFNWIDIKASYMTNLSDSRWRISGGPFIDITKRIRMEWRLEHWGDEHNDYGGSKLVLRYKFN